MVMCKFIINSINNIVIFFSLISMFYDLICSPQIWAMLQIVYNYHDLRLTQNNVDSPTITCEHICDYCHKSSLYQLIKPRIKMDKKFRAKLRKDPYNVGKLWKLLNLVHQQFEPLALPGQLVKLELTNAYEGRPDPLVSTTE